MNANTGNIFQAINVCKSLYSDYTSTTDSNYKVSLSNVIIAKLAVISATIAANNSNMLSEIAKLQPH